MGAIFCQPRIGYEQIRVEEHEDYLADTRDFKPKSSNLTVDSVYRAVARDFKPTLATNFKKHNWLRFRNPQLAIEAIVSIQEDFDEHDKISLIFLLYDYSLPKTALQCTRMVIREGLEDVVGRWINSVACRERTWQLKLLEALSIIQNYSALRKLGYLKSEVTSQFRPTNRNFSLCIPLNRKKLYRIFKHFDREQTDLFLKTVEMDFKMLKLLFNTYNYLEMYFLHWTSINYISNENLDNIGRALRIMGMYKEAEEFKKLEPVNGFLLSAQNGATQSTSSNLTIDSISDSFNQCKV